MLPIDHPNISFFRRRLSAIIVVLLTIAVVGLFFTDQLRIKRLEQELDVAHDQQRELKLLTEKAMKISLDCVEMAKSQQERCGSLLDPIVPPAPTASGFGRGPIPSRPRQSICAPGDPLCD